MHRLFGLAALAVVSALVLAACGGSSYGGNKSPSTTAAPAPAATSSAATISAKSSSLGTFLVDAKGRTLYLWEADKGTMSTCSGACAAAWPPLTTKGMPKASGSVKSSLLGTTKRSDGTSEVTYHGHPLYYFAGDAAPGQTAGQGNAGFGALWYVVRPSGSALTGS